MEFKRFADEFGACPAPLPRPLRVLLLLGSLHGGGAERVAVQLLRGLDPARFDVAMGLLRAAGPYLAEADTSRVMAAPRGERFDFDGPGRALLRPAKLLNGAIAAPRAFRAMIEEFRPDVVLSFLKGTNLIAWRALAGLSGDRPRWIAREGNNVLAVIADETPGPLAARAVRELTARAYTRADRVLTLSAGLAGDIARDLSLDPGKIAWIPNPVDIARVRQRADEPLPDPGSDPPTRPFVLAAGRLERQKGHDLLLRAYAACGAAASHDLVILGQGSLASDLRAQADRLGIARQVRFAGFAANPFAWMAKCALFVLPSRWEGFGSVLAEAMAAGAPVLAADCAYGPREIVAHGETGWLVPVEDAAALGAAMQRLLGDPALRHRLAEAGQASAERFALPVILERYGALLEAVGRGGERAERQRAARPEGGWPSAAFGSTGSA